MSQIMMSHRTTNTVLVGLFSMSEIAPAETKPTVGASAVAINKNTNEVWMSTVIAGELSFANEL